MIRLDENNVSTYSPSASLMTTRLCIRMYESVRVYTSTQNVQGLKVLKNRVIVENMSNWPQPNYKRIHNVHLFNQGTWFQLISNIPLKVFEWKLQPKQRKRGHQTRFWPWILFLKCWHTQNISINSYLAIFVNKIRLI